MINAEVKNEGISVSISGYGKDLLTEFAAIVSGLAEAIPESALIMAYSAGLKDYEKKEG